MMDKFAGIAISALVVAGMTTLVYPGRQTVGVVREGTTGIAKIVNALIGRG